MKRIGKYLDKFDGLPLIGDEENFGQKRSSGNFSFHGAMFDKQLRGFFMTASKVKKSNPSKDNIVYVEKVDHSSRIIHLAGIGKPSRGLFIHHQIYKDFPEIKVIIHTHDNKILELKNIPITKSVFVGASMKHAKEVVDLLKLSGRTYINLRSHGQLAISTTVDDVLKQAKKYNLEAQRKQ